MAPRNGRWVGIGSSAVAAAGVLLVLAALPGRPVGAFSFGPPAGHTGAPGELTCVACHPSFPVDSGAGRVRVGGLPLHYTPGQAVALTVTTTQPDGFRYGFQLTALGAGGASAGTLVVTDAAATQLFGGSVDGQPREYLEHTLAGVAPLEFNRRVWSFTWVAPSTDVGAVTFYATGNGADGNSEPTGDYVYTSRQTIACTGTTPASQSFSAQGGEGTLAIGSGCDWVATPADGWISLTSPSSGTGDGTLSYVVAPNPGPGPRAGTILIGGLAVPVLQGGSFADVPPSHPFHEFVGRLSARGVTQGCGGGLFCPDAPVIREQMAFFLLRALGEAVPPSPASDRFLDVPPTNPFYAFIDRLAVLNITQGCGVVSFCPGASVSREQMAVFIIRALGEGDPSPPPVPTFLDVPPSSAFYPFVEALVARGVTVGCGDGRYCPTSPVTRGQMAVFLVRAFNL
jgi:S-layer homology domain